MGREIRGGFVLEAGVSRERLKRLALDQCVHVPALAEALDRLCGGRVAVGRGPPGVVADDQKPARSDESGAFGEEARGGRAVDKRLDRICQIGRFDLGREIAVVALGARDPVRQTCLAHPFGREPRLDGAECDAGAVYRQTRGEITQARPDTAAEVDDMRDTRDLESRGEATDFVGDPVFDIPKRLLTGRRSRAPHRAVNRADVAAPSVGDEGGRVTIVVAANLRGIESRGHGVVRSLATHDSSRA